jgi:hypothetical protein
MPKTAPYLLALSIALLSYTLSERAHHEMLDHRAREPYLVCQVG